MRIVDIIQKKAEGKEFDANEINFVISGIVNKTIPDYMITSWLMAIYINGLTKHESYLLTKAMIQNGQHVDLSKFKGNLVDKHSTGGIGDKVTLVLSPILASLGIAIAKMSGRGLGFTGGTIDKLEAIKVQTSMTPEQMVKHLKKHGIFVAGQTKNVAPADKIIYNLRDVTGTVSNMGLIASSILSKKFSIFGTHVFLDIKCGSGAFCSSYSQAKELIKYLSYIAKAMKRKLTMVVTNMNQPLGKAIGNAIEVREAQDFLRGNYNDYPDLKELIFKFASIIIRSYKHSLSDARAQQLIEQTIRSGKALNKFYEWIQSQGGDIKALKADSYFKPKYKYEMKATKSGYLTFRSISHIGMVSSELGAGRILKTDKIDMQAGICLRKKYGDKFKVGDILAVCYSSKPIDKKKVWKEFIECCTVAKFKPRKVNVIRKVVYA